MGTAAVAVITLVVFVWGLFSARLGRADLSAPIVFVAIGLLLSHGMHIVQPEQSREVVKLLAEVTLVWVLFADAARVRIRDLRVDVGIYARLLAVGLPLTIAAGTLSAMWLFDGMSVWLALLVGAALAPTDAALGAAVMTDPAVPERVRRVINVESGLNDGIATPVVMIAIAGAAAAEHIQGEGTGAALIDLAIGLAVGISLGVVGGRAMRTARRRGWASEDFAGPAVLALALTAYAGTLWLDGNGFVAAFVGGLAFGNAAGRGGLKEVFYVEQTAGLVSLLTWLLFGAIAVPIVLEQAGWQTLAYAALSLTAVRMLPVALVMIGAGLPRPAVAFIGWFGPRGLASIIFALIAVEELHDRAEPAAVIIGTTVLISVFAHGLSARPLAGRYAARAAERGSSSAPVRVAPQMPVRGLLHTNADTTPPDAGIQQ
jgi:NhaP-type Na+/H+ or K+/H+ antiporter